jgi:predicted ATP-dependent endonuclease of OLD family
MAINRIEIKDFLVFKGEFTADFCSEVNVLIGGNGTGKTTLLKTLYAFCNMSSSTKIINSSPAMNPSFIVKKYFTTVPEHTDPSNGLTGTVSLFDNDISEKSGLSLNLDSNLISDTVYIQDLALFRKWVEKNVQSVYIPEKDLLSNLKGLPETYEYGKAQYTQCEIDIVKKARVLADTPEQPLYKKICDIISGQPQNDGQSFYMKRNNIAVPVPFSMEASGYRKFGLLATLIRNEQIKPDSILFWDELENSLNPELIPALVDVLLELSRNGVQIFIATHSEMLASYFSVNQQQGDKVMFYSLYRDENGKIKADSNNRFDLLEQNKLTDEPVKLYEKQIEKGLGNG